MHPLRQIKNCARRNHPGGRAALYQSRPNFRCFWRNFAASLWPFVLACCSSSSAPERSFAVPRPSYYSMASAYIASRLLHLAAFSYQVAASLSRFFRSHSAPRLYCASTLF